MRLTADPAALSTARALLTETAARRAASGTHALDARGWDIYLFAAVALMPLVASSLPGQLAWVDLVNGAALALFAVLIVERRLAFSLPLLGPVLVAALGSVLAVAGANSVPASLLALTQDAYLYAWMVLLVALLRRRGDLARFRLAWVAAAVGVALACVFEWATHPGASLGALVSARGYRAMAAFGNPNLCANYLLLGAFVLLSLEGSIGRRVLVPGLGALGLALLTTKSNGGLLALALGLAVWALVRSRSRGAPTARLVGVLSLSLAAALAVVWIGQVTGGESTWLRSLEEHTLLGRVEHSSASREHIWQRLERTIVQAPMGIGPANSSAQSLDVSERERGGSLQSKEAHSDYIGYAVERGPLGLLGLLAGIVQLGALVLRGRRGIEERCAASPAGRVKRGSDAGSLHAALAGGMAALLVQSLVLEQLHFRHLWAFVALICAATAPAEVEVASPAAGRAPGSELA